MLSGPYRAVYSAFLTGNLAISPSSERDFDFDITLFAVALPFRAEPPA